MDEAADRILSICRNPICLENILQELFRDYGLTMSFGQYVLIGSTVRFCLSWHRRSFVSYSVCAKVVPGPVSNPGA